MVSSSARVQACLLFLVTTSSWHTSRGFLRPFLIPLHPRIKDQQTTQQHSLYSTTTQLKASKQRPQKKSPRFSQKAHSKKTKSAGTKRPNDAPQTKSRASSSKPQPWESQKSIDELENIMTKRWGTLDPSPSRPKQTSKASGVDFRRPVLDPWAKDNDNQKSNGAADVLQIDSMREFYDEDDEGFEYVELDDDDDIDGFVLEDEEGRVVRGEQRVPISHLIAPKPVGGRGTNQVAPSKEASTSSSYFFNPNKQQPSKTQNSQQNPSSTQASSTNTSDERSDKQTKRSKPPQAKTLLDEDGEPILLTVDEALSRFQETIDDDSIEVMEMTDALPIVAYSQSQSWSDLGITSDALLENLDYLSCPTPLAVQEKAIPPVLTGNDVLVGTYTGSGKTLAFLTPLIQKLLWDIENGLPDPGLAVLIVAPGRELASQIASVARNLVEDTSLTVQLAIGGTTFSRNLEQLRKRKPNIVVGTPGRIAELVVGKPGEKSGRLKIGSLQALVMDEFDALLEYKPHRDPTRAIMQALKRRHGDALQSILCSATASDIMDSAKVTEFLRPGFATAMADEDDVLVTGTVEKSKKARKRPQVSRTVLHGVVHIPHRRFALDTIRRILHTEPIPQQILIFVENARKVDIVVDKLANQGIVAAPLHGGQGSEKTDRAEVSKALREGYVGIVVATELAARGLDAPLLTHVINMDLPTDASHYAHRAGRCGRGGRPGVVINMTTSPKERNVPKRFADTLDIEMHPIEARQGKLVLLDPDTLVLDP